MFNSYMSQFFFKYLIDISNEATTLIIFYVLLINIFKYRKCKNLILKHKRKCDKMDKFDTKVVLLFLK